MRTCAHGDVIHENNRIRRLNESLQCKIGRLQAEGERLKKELDDARRSLASSHAMKEHYRTHYEDIRAGGDR